MKAPAFWYRPAGVTSALLSPFSLAFRTGACLRKIFAKPYKAKVPVICIGNIVAGGAGKTPTALAIAEYLIQKGAKPVFVTRGYGGSECGPIEVDPSHHKAQEVGDEALLLARMAPTWSGRDRAATIQMAEKHGTHIILDDGLQNPHIAPDLSFLIIDGGSGTGNGKIIPAGPLRENLKDAEKRIAAIILIGANDAQNIAEQVSVPVLRAKLNPDLPHNFPAGEKFFAFAGIAQPEKFYRTCRETGLDVIGTKDFPDHHAFSDAQILELMEDAASHSARLLTTEKDWIRLRNEQRAQIATLPVKLVFDAPQELEKQLSRLGRPT